MQTKLVRSVLISRSLATRLSTAVAIGAFTALSLLPVSPADAQRIMSTPSGEIRYMNGGFGEEQADLMRQMSSEFPVRFTFSRHNAEHNTDEFVADVRLRGGRHERPCREILGEEARELGAPAAFDAHHGQATVIELGR